MEQAYSKDRTAHARDSNDFNDNKDKIDSYLSQ